MKFTVFGGNGFIGRNLVEYLKKKGHDVLAPARGTEDNLHGHLGHVIYSIGLTGDFRNRPFDTIEAHVSMLARVLRRYDFNSWLYLSSTRVYGRLDKKELAREDLSVPIFPNSDGLYDISKLAGEALCLSQNSPAVRVARLSNVYGRGQSKHTFLAEIFEELKSAQKAVIRESPKSAKDYIALTDILPLLEAIALYGRDRIYNLASGKPVTHAALAQKLEQLTGLTVRVDENAPLRYFPTIDISRITDEFKYVPTSLIDNLSGLLEEAGLMRNGGSNE